MQNPSLVSPHRRRPRSRWTTRLILTAALLTTYHVGAPLSVQGGGAPQFVFSEYIEGSSNNKALEIFNGTGGTVNLATQGYNVQIFFNGGSTAGLTITSPVQSITTRNSSHLTR